jgi:hypothetical protein
VHAGAFLRSAELRQALRPRPNDSTLKLPNYSRWVALFSTEVFIFCVGALPRDLTLYNFGFHDEGSNLTIHYLVGQGLRPAVDFGYFYGLLSVLLARCFPPTPFAYQAIILGISLLMAWALARYVVALRLPLAGVVLIACTLPFAIMPLYWNYARGFEAALLCNALAEQAAGRRATALALVTGACLLEPELGYIYGLLLLVLMLDEYRRRATDAAGLLRALGPALLTGVSLLTMLIIAFGMQPLERTIVPINGAQTYKLLHYGLLRAGVRLIYFPGVKPGYYLGNVVGLYVIGTCLLFIYGLKSLHRIFAETEPDRARELTVTCAVLHASFLFIAFGGASSWAYYSYILVIGLASATPISASFARLAWPLALLALLGSKSTLIADRDAWSSTVRSNATAGLWANPREAQEWLQVRRIAQGRPAVILSWAGAGFLLAPEVLPRPALYLIPGNSTDGDVLRQAEQLSQARFVIMRADLDFQDWSLNFAGIRQALGQYQMTWRGKYFKVLERASLPATGSRSAQTTGGIHNAHSYYRPGARALSSGNLIPLTSNSQPHHILKMVSEAGYPLTISELP